MDYLNEIGTQYGEGFAAQFPGFSGRRLASKQAMSVLIDYERDLVSHLIEMLQSLPGVQIAGITDTQRYEERVPTIVFVKDGVAPVAVADYLGNRGIYVWDGNYYAVEIMNRLGRGDHGMVRVGLAHYNTHDEIDRLEAALQEL